MENSISEQLNWRYATKKFDTSKKLSQQQIDGLLTAIQLAPTSYGLQPFKVLVVSNPAIREQLKAAAYGQPQVTDASELLVFATYANYTEAHVDEYATNIIATRGVKPAEIQGFVDTMKGTVKGLTQEQLQAWNTKQAYIALGFLLQTAALEGIDACPMEGFDVAKFDEILGLADKNLRAIVIAPIGFRADDDTYQFYKKVRVAKEDLFINV